MIPMEVREQDKIQRGQLVDLQGRIGLAGGRHPIAEVHLFVPMDEVWVREDCEPSITNQDRRRPKKDNRPGA
jgi:hypothetical protein